MVEAVDRCYSILCLWAFQTIFRPFSGHFQVHSLIYRAMCYFMEGASMIEKLLPMCSGLRKEDSSLAKTEDRIFCAFGYTPTKGSRYYSAFMLRRARIPTLRQPMQTSAFLYRVRAGIISLRHLARGLYI